MPKREYPLSYGPQLCPLCKEPAHDGRPCVPYKPTPIGKPVINVSSPIEAIEPGIAKALGKLALGRAFDKAFPPITEPRERKPLVCNKCRQPWHGATACLELHK